MAFPVIFDVIVVAVMYVELFTPKVVNQNAIMATTVHPKYYQMNVYNGDIEGKVAENEWNAWTIWNTANLVLSALLVGFYVYIIIAIIVAAVDDESGLYSSTTALLNEDYNMYIFYALNTIYLLVSAAKFSIGQLVIESFNVLDEEWLAVWDDLAFYIWD